MTIVNKQLLQKKVDELYEAMPVGSSITAFDVIKIVNKFMQDLLEVINDTGTEEVTDEDKTEIARLVAEGFTSGRLDGEDGKKVAWELQTHSWKD